jgi:hypothetical protein
MMNPNTARNNTTMPAIIPPATAPALLLLAPETATAVLLDFASFATPVGGVDAAGTEVIVTVTGGGGVVVVEVLVESGTELEEFNDAVRDDAEGVSSLDCTLTKSRKSGSALTPVFMMVNT